MRRLFPLFLAIILTLLASGPCAGADGGERILSYNSVIVVNGDATMAVTETIRVNCLGISIRHGIFRDFPTDYRDAGGNRRRVGFQVLRVLRDGQPENYSLERLYNGVRVKIGLSGYLLPPGEYNYTIIYQTDRQLGFFADHDELYWNVTGNGWDFTIGQVSATVILPVGNKADILTCQAFTGLQGARGADYRATINESGTVSFVATAPLPSSAGLTIVVSWSKGFVTPPTRVQELDYLLRDNKSLVIGWAGFLLALLYFYLIWNKYGRDPAKGVMIPRFKPPEGFSPASVRYISRMGYDTRIMAAAIINMAVNKYLVIRNEGKEYTIVREQSAPVAALSPAEQKIAAGLFGTGNEFTFKQGNHEQISKTSRELHEYLKAKFQNTVFKTNRLRFIPGLTVSIVTLFAAYLTGPVTIQFVVLTPLAVAANIVFYTLFKAPTPAGRRIMDEIDGFKQYLAVAEKDRLNLLNPPDETPELFERYLPYALALGVEQRWSERFAGILSRAAAGDQGYHPLWYYGDHWNGRHIGHFATSLGSSFSGAISSSSMAPGSSSGSGGGGFSGGGGGGGGGGGW